LGDEGFAHGQDRFAKESSLAKFQLHRKIPWFRGIYTRLDQARHERDESAAQLGRVSAGLEQVTRERDRLAAEIRSLATERCEAEAVLQARAAHVTALEAERDALAAKSMQAGAAVVDSRCEAEGAQRAASMPRIQITRGERGGAIDPAWFEGFPFRSGDILTVLPEAKAAKLPNTWGDTHIRIGDGHAIRVPPCWDMYEFKGFSIPSHLIRLTGGPPEQLDSVGKAHIANYQRFVGLRPDMTILEVGCGIGRDAFQLLDFFDDLGRYIGVDVTRDSIIWCQDNIGRKHANFTFHHFDAFNELYNPFGTKTSMEFRIPTGDGSVDRIVLASVFTHLLEDEVLHYLTEFRRVLKPSGLVYASFFLYSPEAIAAAQEKGNTPWRATFSRHYGNGVYGNDPTYQRGAVAFSDETMRRLIDKAGLRLMRPFLKGWWSGLHENPEDGQDAAIVGI
jgi:SAM-dependent methyltransferase